VRAALRCRLLRVLLGAGLLLPPLGADRVRAQLPPPLPPPPPPPSPSPLAAPAAEADLVGCVASYGNTGCAARLYAQLLCDSFGTRFNGGQLSSQLDQQYAQAGIDFRGISPEQVERAAVRYYAPMLCPAKSGQIRQLFKLS